MKFLLLSLLSLSTILGSQFCISTYNVENLFDAKYDGTEYKQFIPSKFGWSEEEVRVKIENTLKVLRDLNSEIYALQEVETEELIIRIKKELGFKYHYFAKNKTASIGLGLISKYPITKRETYSLKGYDKLRPILFVRVDIGGKDLDLWVNHWPSLRNPDETRIAYANSLKYRMDNIKSDDFIALGDFNTLYDPSSIIRKTFKNTFYDPWREIPKKDRWSFVYKNNRNVLDRILLSNSLVEGENNFLYIKKSFKPYKANYLLDKKGRPVGSFKKLYSDHLPLSACFETKFLLEDVEVVEHSSDEGFFSNLKSWIAKLF